MERASSSRHRMALHRYDNGMEWILEWEDYKSRASVARRRLRPPCATPLLKIKGHRPPPSPPLRLTASAGFLVSPGFTANCRERCLLMFWKANVVVSPQTMNASSSRSGNEDLCTSAGCLPPLLSLRCSLVVRIHPTAERLLRHSLCVCVCVQEAWGRVLAGLGVLRLQVLYERKSSQCAMLYFSYR